MRPGRFAFGGILLGFLTVAVPIQAQTFTLQAVADTSLRDGTPNQNRGNDPIVLLSSGDSRVLLRFDQASIISAVGSGRLVSASLELFVRSASGNWGADGRPLEVHRLAAAWTEAGATWNCAVDTQPANSRPDCPTQWVGGTFEEDSSDTVLQTRDERHWVQVDVTADVAAFLAGTSNQGWLLKKSEVDPVGQVEYASREGAVAERPRLVLLVETAVNDQVPPSLAITSPSRPILVNEPSPTVVVEYGDGGSGVDTATFRVLMDGQDVTASCTTGTQSASCHPLALTAGSHTVQARLRDRAGNAAQASFSFQLLLGSGPHLVTFQALGDATLRKAEANRNFGAEPTLRLRQGGQSRSVVRFDPQSLSATLAGATLISAFLELHIERNGRNWGKQGRTVDTHRMTVAWTETGATWNCANDSNPSNQRPDCASQWSGGTFSTVPTASVLHTRDLTGWIGFNVTADIPAFVSGTLNHGWLIKKTDERKSGRVDYDSRQGTAGEGPRLVLVFQTDTTAPTIANMTPAEGSFVASSRPTISASYSDAGSGVSTSSVRLLLDGVDRTGAASVTATGVTFMPEALAPGPHSAVVSASDFGGNSTQASWSFTVDTVPPILQIALPTGPIVIEEPIYTLTVQYSDSLSGVDTSSLAVVVDGVDITLACIRGTNSATCSTSELSTGQYAITASVRDLVGNLAEASGVLDLVVDLAPPVVTLQAPQDGTLVGATPIAVTGLVSDDGQLSAVTVNGNPATLSEGAFSAQLNLEEGMNGVVVVAVDSTGKRSFAAAAVILDTQPPALTIESPQPGALTNQDSIQLSGRASDINGIDRVEIAGTPVLLEDGRFSQLLPLQDGTNSFAILSIDSAGNSATAEVAVTRFSLPEVTITAPEDLSWTSTTTIDVVGTVGPGVASVSVNGIPATLTGSGFVASDVPLLEGGNILTASAVDAQGHVATDSVSLVRDLTPPRLEIYGPISGTVVTEPAVAVFGLVNDIVPGTVNASEVSVLVNGQPAEVANRSFLLPALSLAEGPNEIVVTATDASGNRGEERVSVRREVAVGRQVEVVSGNRQSAVIGSELPVPLKVRVRDANGLPATNVPVLFKVSGNNGSLDGGRRQIAVATDASGEAKARFTLGTHVGVGSQRIEIVVVSYGSAEFLEDALPDEASVIVVDSGDQQVGVAGQELPRPLVTVVTDAGHNRLEGVPVKFTVAKGAGEFRNSLREIVVATDSDGRAIVPFRLDPQEGTGANVVEARIETLPDGPSAAFTATGWTAGDPGLTAVKGIVLDNTNLPVPGVTIRIKDTALTAQSDSHGVFRIQPAPVGTFYLIIDGSTTTRPGAWPDLEFVMTTVPGRESDLGMPIYLLPLNQVNGILVDETRGGTINLAEIPGFALEIRPGSVTFPRGSRSGLVSVTAVHSDKIPMVPNFGQQPRFIVTVQPSGARFDPPARMTLPNLEGLVPGEVTEFYSFDHDLGHFVSIGPATVSADGLLITSNSGVGILKAGWHCGGNPTSTGTAHNCPTCFQCSGSTCVPESAQALQDQNEECCFDLAGLPSTYDLATECCTPDGVREKTSLSFADIVFNACPERTARTGYIPSEDHQCSPDIFILGVNPLNNPAGGANTHFGGFPGTPCSAHDRCYRTCKREGTDAAYKASCDGLFCVALRERCDSSGDSFETILWCRYWADRYCNAVRTPVGRYAYDMDQAKACQCCQ